MNSITFNEDCIEGMKRFENNHFDIAIVDPPYGINAPNMAMGSAPNRTEGGYSSTSTVKKLKGRLNTGSGKLKNRLLNKSSFDWDNEKPSQEYWDELFRVSKNQIIFGGNYFNLPPTRCIICWDKCQPWENFSQFELCWTSFDKPAAMIRVSNTGGGNKEEKFHPTQKPILLYDKIMNRFCEKGMKILDTHLGSQSSRIAAHKNDLDFTGFEISSFYFTQGNQRFDRITSQLTANFPE